MSQDARDLRNAGLYLVASAVLAAGLVLGGAFFAERAIVNPAVAEIVTSAFAETGSSLETMPESMPTRLSVVVANAREIFAPLWPSLIPRWPRCLRSRKNSPMGTSSRDRASLNRASLSGRSS